MLSYAISRNPSDFCRFVTVVALREFGAESAILVRIDKESILRSVGSFGSLRPLDGDAIDEYPNVGVLKQAITHNRVIESDGFIAIPFSPSGEVLGALGLSFRPTSIRVKVPSAELELLQLLAELIAVNSLPRMRTAGLLSKIYFDQDDLTEVSTITHRQLRILDEMAIGKTNGQIALSLNVSESTVKQESVRIFRILGVNSRQRAVSAAKDMGLI